MLSTPGSLILGILWGGFLPIAHVPSHNQVVPIPYLARAEEEKIYAGTDGSLLTVLSVLCYAPGVPFGEES